MERQISPVEQESRTRHPPPVCGRVPPFFAVLVVLCTGCSGKSGDESNDTPEPTGTLTVLEDRCEIEYGEQECNVELTWTAQNAEEVCLFDESGAQRGCWSDDAARSGSDLVNITSGDHTLTLRAGITSNSEELDSEDVRGINLPGFKILEFDPPSVGPGESSTIRWEAEYAEECTSEQIDEIKDPVGSLTQKRGVEGDWAVTVVCVDEYDNEASDTAILTVVKGDPWSLSSVSSEPILNIILP